MTTFNIEYISGYTSLDNKIVPPALNQEHDEVYCVFAKSESGPFRLKNVPEHLRNEFALGNSFIGMIVSEAIMVILHKNYIGVAVKSYLHGHKSIAENAFIEVINSIFGIDVDDDPN